MAPKDKQTKERLQGLILQLVKEGITGTEQLMERIGRELPMSELRLFYPALSGLNLANLLCWHWKYSQDGPTEKHFFLTGEGEKKVKTYAVHS